jgi:hypothetical protein
MEMISFEQISKMKEILVMFLDSDARIRIFKDLPNIAKEFRFKRNKKVPRELKEILLCQICHEILR